MEFAHTPAETRRHNFLVIDGLRGVAAACVLIAHASAIVLGHPLLPHKYMAVQFFFMLSGFVVMCAYERKLKYEMSFGQFALRRVVRLYPLMIVGALMGWLYFASFEPKFADDPDSMHAVALAALGLPISTTHFNFGQFPINPPEWSLYFELIAYLGFGLLVRWASTKLLCIAATLGMLMYTFCATHFYGYGLPFWMNIFGVGASFSIGMLLWRGYEAGLAKSWNLPFYILAIVMSLVCVLPEPAHVMLNPLLVLLVFPAMIFFGANREKVASRKFLVFIGELSYPLYILHWPVLLFAKHFFLPTIGPAMTTAVGCAFAVAVSWSIYSVFDKPFRTYLNARLFPTVTEHVAQGA